MKLYRKILVLVILIIVVPMIIAQEKPKFSHKLLVGYNLGATAPIPLPRQIRSITAVWPEFTPQLGYNITYSINPKWGIASGALLDLKGFGVRDKVKYMYTTVVLNKENNNQMSGYFVGKNETRVRSTYLTIPLFFTYSMSEKWQFKAGGYIAYLHSGDFKGDVWDGYLRQNTIDGSKINIEKKGDAYFDFGDEMRKLDYGVSIGAERTINEKFGVYANLNWGLNPIFHSDFKAIEFDMYNVYLTLGLTYNLK